MSKTEVFLSLGSNLGDRFACLGKAVIEIEREIGRVIKKSKIYETDSWGFKNRQFLNNVIIVESELSPQEILKKIDIIEKRLGRTVKTTVNENGKNIYSERTIDIDILFYGDEIVNTPELKIPHPNLHRRNFVLVPLNEIAPDKTHPLLGVTMAKILKYSSDMESVEVFA